MHALPCTRLLNTCNATHRCQSDWSAAPPRFRMESFCCSHTRHEQTTGAVMRLPHRHRPDWRPSQGCEPNTKWTNCCKTMPIHRCCATTHTHAPLGGVPSTQRIGVGSKVGQRGELEPGQALQQRGSVLGVGVTAFHVTLRGWIHASPTCFHRLHVVPAGCPRGTTRVPG